MKKLFIKKLCHLIEYNETIFQLNIDDPIIFRELAFSIEDNIIFSIDDKEINLYKYMLKIDNLFSLDINDKKFIGSLYKRIISQISDDQRLKIANIENLFIDLFEEISTFSDDRLTYKMEIDLPKLFNIFQLNYQECEKENYLEYLLSYIKINIETNGTLIIVSFNLLNILTDDEILLLKKELTSLDIVLFDLSLTSNIRKVEHLIIDNEWCIL